MNLYGQIKKICCFVIVFLAQDLLGAGHHWCTWVDQLEYVCLASFNNRNDYLEHVEGFHIDRGIVVNQCRLKVDSEKVCNRHCSSNIKNHVRKEHTSVTDVTSIMKHKEFEPEKNGEKFICLACNKSFCNYFKLIDHKVNWCRTKHGGPKKQSKKAVTEQVSDTSKQESQESTISQPEVIVNVAPVAPVCEPEVVVTIAQAVQEPEIVMAKVVPSSPEAKPEPVLLIEPQELQTDFEGLVPFAVHAPINVGVVSVVNEIPDKEPKKLDGKQEGAREGHCVCSWAMRDSICAQEFDAQEALKDHVLTVHNNKEKKCHWFQMRAGKASRCGRNLSKLEFEEHIIAHLAGYFGEKFSGDVKKSSGKKKIKKEEKLVIIEHGDERDNRLEMELIERIERVNFGKKHIKIPERNGVRTIEKCGYTFMVTEDRLLYYCQRCNWAFALYDRFDRHIRKHGWIKQELWRASAD